MAKPKASPAKPARKQPDETAEALPSRPPAGPLPLSVRLRCFDVGFGDCFLLTLTYGDNARHVLFDFGSTAKRKSASKTAMLDIANSIAETCRYGIEPLIVVATHRHQDHIRGFDPNTNDTGPGAIIRSLKPKLVVQPWTEHPNLATDATHLRAPKVALPGHAAHVQKIANMQRVGALAARETAAAAQAGDKLANEINFIGEDAIQNPRAVQNLMRMGKREYLHFGKKSRIADHLPGVEVHVLGPPTLKQSDSIRRQRQKDDDEFWRIMGAAGGTSLGLEQDGAHELKSPFDPQHHQRDIPPSARWFVRHATRIRYNELLHIVRVLDRAINNTSLILLLKIGRLSLLFPGDAQIEDWEYALKSPEHAERVRELLRDVRLYKVGHHGSTNATPQTLWKLFRKRNTDPNAKERLASALSTMPGKHHQVPRNSLVKALKAETEYCSTQGFRRKLYRDLVWTRRGTSWKLTP